MVTGGLQSVSKRENIAYLRSRRKFPLRIQHTTMTHPTENKYSKLKQYIESHTSEVEWKTRAPWISSDTWKLIDSRASKTKSQSFLPGEQQQLSRRIKQALHRDRKQRTIKAAAEIEQNLQSGWLKAAWNVLQNWYKHTGDHPPWPTWMDLWKLTNEYKVLYCAT
jgi:hypothetical protein